MWVSLSTREGPEPARVGGKAASLIRLSRSGFRVPAGVVLTTAFFRDWIEQVERGEAWRAVTRLAGDPDGAAFRQACDAAKKSAANLALGAAQREALDAARAELGPGRFAVRSSSPEEDLEGASFAGLYETRLDTPADELEPALRACFESCLDSRVLLYKSEMHFARLAPSIAVVIQEQVESETSGVAFSVNPLNNDHDELLVNASWGLGEALVSGEIAPDRIVVDKISGSVLESQPGDKGGDRPEQTCLDADAIEGLCQTVCRIEQVYGVPVDVEWAFAGGELHVLQARPITTCIPIAPELATEPGAPRALYLDGAISDGLTLSGAITPMTNDTFEQLYRAMLAPMFDCSEDEIDLDLGGFYFTGARIYMNLSMYMHLMGGSKAMARQAESVNALMGEILLSNDIERYRPAKPPRHLRIPSLIRHTLPVLWRCRSVIRPALAPWWRPERFAAHYADTLRAFDAWATRPLDPAESFETCVADGLWNFGVATIEATAPAILSFMYLGQQRVRRLARPDSEEQQRLADAICRGYPDDIIVQMGLAMFDLAHALPEAELEDLETLRRKLLARQLPDEFLSRWDAFVERFGCRGPLEMELANPKYGEDPMLALSQIATIRASVDAFDPHEVQRDLVAERERAYEQLMALLPRRKRRKLARGYRNIVRHAGSREMIKHHLMQVYDRMRRHLLRSGDELVAANRLDRRDQIFELTMRDLRQAMDDESFDVRECARARGAFYRRVRKQVRHFPTAIDSRGRILRPEIKQVEWGLVGSAVSPGVARGPVRVLNDPFEKTVEPGDVLVAVATDPGWTPLFINAAAVLLEVGGELQHGALVAREYGKPCVAGIPDITNRLRDGQQVEVDGSSGTVRFLEPASQQATEEPHPTTKPAGA